MYFPAALSSLFICALFLHAHALISSEYINNHRGLRPSKYEKSAHDELANTNKLSNTVNQRQPREDEEEEDTTFRPALYPLLVKLFATSIGANETQANRTADRFVANHNGIDIYKTSTDSSVTSDLTKLSVSEEEEEDEDEDTKN